MKNENIKKIKFVIILTFFLNLLVSLIKIVLGIYSNSASIKADGIHSLSDAFNNIVGFVAISFAYRPADENHPYGHKKYETILSLFIGVILFILGYNLIKDSLTTFNKNNNLSISNLEIVMMIATLFVNIFVTRYQLRQGKKLHSSFLMSDAKHTMSDVYVTVSVIVSLIGIKYFNLPHYLDNIMSIVVALIIFKASFEIVFDAIKVLSDSRQLDTNEVKKLVMSFQDVLDTHMIKSRGVSDDIYLELHILVDPKMSIEKAHILNHEIESKLREHFQQNLEVIIHIEPYDHKH